MKITALTAQLRDRNRVNVFIDGTYHFSVDITQVLELGLRIGRELDEKELAHIELESQFGKLYTRALEYVLMRPRSRKEVRDYLYRKTRDTLTKTGTVKKGASKELTERVYERLDDKKYLNDESFAKYWVENRRLRKGVSRRKLQEELFAKGVDRDIVEKAISDGDRHDNNEIQKFIEKRAHRYDDEKKLIAYLARQGFSYDDIKKALSTDALDDEF